LWDIAVNAGIFCNTAAMLVSIKSYKLVLGRKTSYIYQTNTL